MDINELTTQAGVLTGAFIAAVLAGIIGYFGKRKPLARTDPVLTGVGLELGNRQQVDQIITELKRIADILENKRQAGLEGMLKAIQDDMEEIKAKR